MRRKTGYIQNRGTSFRISYYDLNGIRQFESFKTQDEAQRELAQRLADLSKGLPVSSKPNTVLFGELAVDVINDYTVNKRKSLDDIETRFRLHIIPVFGRRKAAQITTAQLNAYIVQRQRETPTPAIGTINRELEAIRHTFYLALNGGKIHRMPKVPHLRENNTRSGFFTRAEVDKLCSFLPKPIDSFVLFGFLTGWRYSEIQNLRWSNVDFTAGEIRLDPGTTKNGEGRVFPMSDDLRGLLEALTPAIVRHPKHNARRTVHPSRMPTTAQFNLSPVFVINGKPIGAFRKTWKTACYKAGLPCVVESVGKGGKRGAVKVIKTSRLFHDLRRSAARELQRQGFTENEIMKLMGHKSRSMFDRYQIVSVEDLRAKMARLNGARNGAKEGSGITGTQ